MNAFADGIFVDKILALKSLIDHHQFPRIVDFRFREAAAALELDA